MVDDIELISQQCTATSVSFDDEAVADFVDEKLDQGIELSRCLRIWVHTHPGESALPSPTDEATFARVFGRCDWAVMFILDEEGGSYARLRFAAGPGGRMRIPVAVDFSLPFLASDQGRWLQQYEQCVHARERAFDFGRDPFYAETLNGLSDWHDPYQLEGTNEFPF